MRKYNTFLESFARCYSSRKTQNQTITVSIPNEERKTIDLLVRREKADAEIVVSALGLQGWDEAVALQIGGDVNTPQTPYNLPALAGGGTFHLCFREKTLCLVRPPGKTGGKARVTPLGNCVSKGGKPYAQDWLLSWTHCGHRPVGNEKSKDLTLSIDAAAAEFEKARLQLEELEAAKARRDR